MRYFSTCSLSGSSYDRSFASLSQGCRALVCLILVFHSQVGGQEVSPKDKSILEKGREFIAQLNVGQSKFVGKVESDGKGGIMVKVPDEVRARPENKLPAVIQVKDAGSVEGFKQDTPLAITLSSPVKTGSDAQIKDVSVASVAIYNHDYEMKIDPADKTAELEAIHAEVNELQQQAEAFYRAPASDRNLEALLNKNSSLRKLISESYQKLKPGNARVYTARLYKRLEDEAAKALSDSRSDPRTETEAKTALNNASMEEKAIYQRSDNYWPSVYKMIYEQRRSCVAIVAPKGIAPIGSGVLIGRNLVLTCLHVVDGSHATDPVLPPGEYTNEMPRYQVWFDHEKTGGLVDPVPIKCKVSGLVHKGTRVDDTTDVLDYALIEINPPAGAVLPDPLKLSNITVQRMEPLFVIGHPQQHTQWVHDNSWVLLPYTRPKSQLEKLRMLITNDFIDNPCTEGQGDAASRADAFIKSRYLPKPHQPGVYHFIDEWKQNGKVHNIHAIGIESDTFSGDSGSPAMNRLTGHVVGILQVGQSDGAGRVDDPNRNPDYALKPGARVHEALLPIEAIIHQLNQTADKGGLPGWQQSYGVTVITNND